MRVCHFSSTSVNGSYFRNICKGLGDRGVEVSLLELGPPNAPAWTTDEPATNYASLNVTSKAAFPLAVWRLVRLLRRERIDILHVHLFDAGLVGVLSKPFRRRTVVALMRHHTGVVRMLGSRMHVWLDKWMAERADHRITVSDAARDYMRREDGIQGEIDVIHLGFDFDEFRPDATQRSEARAELGFSEDDLVVGYVAGLVPGKGHRELVSAFSEVASEFPAARLLLVGAGELADVTAAIEASPASDRISRAGWRADVARCLNAMDIFAHPSISEAFSQVLIEAMGVGLPVIATDVGGVREVIDDGDNGMIIPPASIEALSDALRHLLDDAALRKERGRRARESVADRFTVDKMVSRHLDLYSRWMEIDRG